MRAARYVGTKTGAASAALIKKLVPSLRAQRGNPVVIKAFVIKNIWIATSLRSQ